MPDTSVVVIHGIIFIESLVIFLGNTFTVFVFWKNRNKLKRTSFLLINLAVADLLVGLGQMITTGGFYIPHYILNNSTLSNDVLKQWILAVPQLCSPYTSVFFLVLISMEIRFRTSFRTSSEHHFLSLTWLLQIFFSESVK